MDLMFCTTIWNMDWLQVRILQSFWGKGMWVLLHLLTLCAIVYTQLQRICESTIYIVLILLNFLQDNIGLARKVGDFKSQFFWATLGQGNCSCLHCIHSLIANLVTMERWTMLLQSRNITKMEIGSQKPSICFGIILKFIAMIFSAPPHGMSSKLNTEFKKKLPKFLCGYCGA